MAYKLDYYMKYNKSSERRPNNGYGQDHSIQGTSECPPRVWGITSKSLDGRITKPLVLNVQTKETQKTVHLLQHGTL